MDRDIRVLFLDGSPNPERYDSIVVDFEHGTEKALKHLTSLGHTRIGYIGGYRPEDPRELAYRKYIEKEAGFDDKLLRASGDWSIHSGYELVNDLIAERCLPTALFVASDPMALGAMRALSEAGLRVPEDIAIVSCNDNELARFTNPPLTTVHVPTQAMGSIAVNMLVGGVIREHCPLQVTVPTKLVIRESCGARKKQMGS
jgi:LacI family transcriptional regulator